MKPNLFKHSVLAVGVIAAMGISTGAMAAETSVGATAGTDIKNTATANYKVGTVDQPQVTSNEVVVKVSETANFSLVASIVDNDSDNDVNSKQPATPGANNIFTHILTNEGNVADTYTINTVGNNDTSLGTVTQDYALNSTSVSYTITQANNVALTDAQIADLVLLNQAQSGSVNDGQAIKLPPGLVANLSYEALTPTDQVAGTTGIGTITASSSFISGNPTLVNENETIVKLPVLKIVKTASCNGVTPCVNFDLNDTNTDFSYNINIKNFKNDYAADAKNFVIRDVLPKGMIIKGTVNVSNIPGASAAVIGTNLNGQQVIDVTVPLLAVDKSISINFDVTVNKDAILDAGNSVVNHATAYDNFDDTTPSITDKENITSDTTDSTNNDIDDTQLPAAADQSGGDGEDSTPTVTLVDRNITISANTPKEIPLTGSVEYSHTITNNGNATEGGTDRPINITITDPTGAALVVRNPVYVDTNGDEKPLVPVDPSTGKYKLPDSVTIAKDTNVVIRYDVVSIGTDTDANSDGTPDDLDISEANIVTVTPGGDTPSAPVNATNTTTIKGLTLVKTQALDSNCDGSINSGTSFGITNVNAEPGQCIIYQIKAKNTSSAAPLGFDITNLLIADKTANFSSGATVFEKTTGVYGSISADTGSTITDTVVKKSAPTTEIGDAVHATVDTLVPQNEATLQFSIKIKTDRTGS